MINQQPKRKTTLRTDVVANLRDENIFIQTAKREKVTMNAIIAAVIADSVLMCKEIGTSWQHSTKELQALFKTSNSASLYSTLVMLEKEGIISKSADGKNAVWSPVLEEVNGKRVINTLNGNDGTWSNASMFLQSPRAKLTFTDIQSIRNDIPALDGATRGYTLIAYDHAAFMGTSNNLRLKVYHAYNRDDAGLKATWFAANELRQEPKGVDLNDVDFWEKATPELFYRNGDAEVGGPIILWRSLPDKFWQPYTSPELRSSLLNKELRSYCDPAKYCELHAKDEDRNAPWPTDGANRGNAEVLLSVDIPSGKVAEAPVNNELELLRKLDSLHVKGNPFDTPEERERLREVRLKNRYNAANNQRPASIRENMVVNTRKMATQEATEEPIVTLNAGTAFSRPIGDEKSIPKTVVRQEIKKTTPVKVEVNAVKQAVKQEAKPEMKPEVKAEARVVNLDDVLDEFKELIHSNLHPDLKRKYIQMRIELGNAEL